MLLSTVYLIASLYLNMPKLEYLSAHATAYCITGVTASGEYTKPGICAAKKEWLGKTIMVYQKLPDGNIGELIGIYECLDTGGTKGIKSGKVVDIWQPDMDSVQKFMDKVYEDGCKGHVYIKVLDLEGDI